MTYRERSLRYRYIGIAEWIRVDSSYLPKTEFTIEVNVQRCAREGPLGNDCRIKGCFVGNRYRGEQVYQITHNSGRHENE